MKPSIPAAAREGGGFGEGIAQSTVHEGYIREVMKGEGGEVVYGSENRGGTDTRAYRRSQRPSAVWK